MTNKWDKKMNHRFIVGDGAHARELSELLCKLGLTSSFVNAIGEGALPRGAKLILGLGDPILRLAALERLADKWEFDTIVHPLATISPSAKIGAGSVICAGSVVSSDAEIGEGVLINWNATIGHDVRVGVGTVVSPQVALSGGVHAGRGCLIGAGSVILQGLEVANFSTVGAGAVVTKSVSAGTTVVGVPAEPIGNSSS